MRECTINIRKLFLLILTYIMIIMHGAVIWSGVIGDGYSSLMIVAAITLFVIVYFDLPFRKSFLLYCVSTAACYFISAFMNGIGLSAGLNIKTALIIDINILLASTLINLGRDKAVTLYVKMVVFLAAISVVCFAGQQLIGNEILPTILFPRINWGRGHWGYLFYSYTKDARNYGMFYEPGVYQVLLNSVLYILFFWDDLLLISEKNKQRYIIVVLLAIVTAASTTGYISAIILLAGFLIKRRGVNADERKLEKRILLIVAIVIIFFGVDYFRNSDNSYLSMYVFGKIDETTITTGAINYNSSGGARLFIVNQALEALKTNPFFGVGSINLSNAIADEFWSGFGTGNVLFSTIATKGLVTLLVTIVPVLYCAYNNRRNKIDFIVFLLVYFNTIVAQSQLLYSSFVFLALLGNLKKDDKNKVEDEML